MAVFETYKADVTRLHHEHDAWSNAEGNDAPRDKYWDAVKSLIDTACEFNPPDHHLEWLASIVECLIATTEEGAQVNGITCYPNQCFTQSVNNLFTAGPAEPAHIESLGELMEITPRVSFQQICKMYNLPGTVIKDAQDAVRRGETWEPPKNWIPPSEVTRRVEVNKLRGAWTASKHKWSRWKAEREEFAGEYGDEWTDYADGADFEDESADFEDASAEAVPMDADQIQGAVEAAIHELPDASNTEIGKHLGLDGRRVAACRKKMEAALASALASAIDAATTE